jgi:hypothetical protein
MFATRKVLRSFMGPLRRKSTRSACFGLYFHLRVAVGPCFISAHDLHLLPVVSEFPAAIQAHHISSGLGRGALPSLSALAAQRETRVLVPATKQCVKNLHLLLQIPGTQTSRTHSRPISVSCWPNSYWPGGSSRAVLPLLLCEVEPGSVSFVFHNVLTNFVTSDFQIPNAFHYAERRPNGFLRSCNQ